ncbi:hypothetical protein Tco_0427964 [Tanacetum coccineum]
MDSEEVKSKRGTEESSKGTEDEMKSNKSKKAESSEEKAKGNRKKILGKKRAGKERQQESSKRQRMKDDKKTDEHEEVEVVDEAELKKYLVIVKDYDIAIDAIPLATKPPVIGIDREDLQTLWKLVKTKHGDTRPENDHERVLWGDLKVMFEPDIKSDHPTKEMLCLKTTQIITTNTLSNIKLPVLQKYDYDTWAMEMEHYLEYIDNEVWKVIQNGNSKKAWSPKKTLTVNASLKDISGRLHGMDDAKEIWAAIKTRFGGNANSKKMQKAILKQQFEAFTISLRKLRDQGYDRFQKLISQLDALGAGVSDEDANHKFLRSLPPAWDSLAMTMKNKPKPLPANTNQATAQEVIVLITLPLPKQQQNLLLMILQEDRRRPRCGWKNACAFDKRRVEVFNCHNTGIWLGCKFKVQKKVTGRKQVKAEFQSQCKMKRKPCMTLMKGDQLGVEQETTDEELNLL